MLKSLYISSFVIIDEVQIEFFNGMSALTGETGAGKSIIIDAIGQLLGDRTQTSFVKKGAQKAYIEGIFDVNNSKFVEICKELNIDVEDEVVVSKEIYSNGKSNIKVNYRNVSLNALKMIMPFLVDVHSQFETQFLFSIKRHIEILDQYIGQDIKLLKKDYLNLYNEYKDLNIKLKQLVEEDLSDEQIEYYQSQLDEIDSVSYTDEEIEDIENELNRLENYEKINETISNFDSLLSNNCLTSLKESLYHISSIKDEGFDEYYEQLYNHYYEIKDIYDSVMNLFNSFHFDEYRFNELQEILFKVNRLKRKYGYSMELIQEKREELFNKIEMINNREEYISKIEKEIVIVKDKALAIAKKMHDLRMKHAKEFENVITDELLELYLPHVKFKVDFKEIEMCKEGIDSVALMISTNKGQELSPLNETASGGEISRIMLAIKTIILQNSNIDTIIFDEVDTGVSGKVASGIGDKMKKLANKKQVICITHLPQVASCAQYQYSIEKEVNDENTVSSIKLLDTNERIEELAKMLSGDHITEEARKNAAILLNV